VHPEKSDWWYDPSASFVDGEGNLNLLTQLNPRWFEETGRLAKVGVGLVSCETRFGHGEYWIDARLPYGDHLWPAFWFWSWDSWPPEIDVFEGYSNRRPNYFMPRLSNPLGFWNLQTNLHWKKDDRAVMLGARNHWMGCSDPTKSFARYGMVWEPSSVSIYWRERLVRKVKDRRILESLNATTLNLIINNGITGDADSANPASSNFVIRDFKHAN
jgi:beta-glucanase (GH16 family)